MGRSGLGELETIVLATVYRLGEEVTGTAAYEDLVERTGRDPTIPAIHVTLRRLEEKGLPPFPAWSGVPARRPTAATFHR